MRYSTWNIYTGGFTATDFGPLPVAIPTPSAGDISTAAALLLSAKNPVLVVGSQATLGAQTIEELSKCVEDLGLPCFLGGMARGLLGRNHPNHIRQGRGNALKKADVVVLAGAVCDFRMDYGRVLNPKSKVIIVNRSRDDLVLNTGITGFWSSTQAVEADPGIFLKQLAASVAASKPAAPWAAWAAELKQKETAVEAGNAAKASAKAYGHGTVTGDRSREA